MAQGEDNQWNTKGLSTLVDRLATQAIFNGPPDHVGDTIDIEHGRMTRSDELHSSIRLFNQEDQCGFANGLLKCSGGHRPEKAGLLIDCKQQSQCWFQGRSTHAQGGHTCLVRDFRISLARVRRMMRSYKR